MKRRSFFKSFMGLVATVALAPEIAFGRKLEMPQVFPSDDGTRSLEQLWWCWSGKDGKEEWLRIDEYVQRWCKESPIRPYRELQSIRYKAGLTVE